MDDPSSYAHLDARSLLSQTPGLVTDFSGDAWKWRNLVELMTFRIQDEAASFDDSDWEHFSQVALALLQGAVQAGAYSRHEAAVRQLNLTVVALHSRPGMSKTAKLRDPRSAAEIALENLPRDPDAIFRAADVWPSLAKSEILALRRVKNLLAPLRAICKIYPNPNLAQWISGYDRLP